MRQRCYNPHCPSYKDYGARGIEVCRSWRDSFENFYADMGDMPPGRTLDRLDNDGPYDPENCTWSTPAQQARNRRTTRWIDIGEGEKVVAADLAQELGMSTQTLIARINRGWTIEKIITRPVRNRAPNKKQRE